jgi:hypothetical protein
MQYFGQYIIISYEFFQLIESIQKFALVTK